MSWNPVQRARAHLAAGGWDEARRCLEEALLDEATPEVLEDLGLAASWCEDGPATVEARERAFAAYQHRGDRRGASRVALLLALDYLEFRSSFAIANGWLQRAHRLLKHEPVCYERGLLAFTEGYLCVNHDPRKAETLGAVTLAVADEVSSVELEMLGLALQGFALVNAGEVERGMNLLDESTAIAVAGEAGDLNAISYTCCQMICACEQVRDYDRADQWYRHLREFSKKWGLRSVFAYCRTRYALLLMYRGEWREAETELLAGERELGAYRPGLATESLVSLGELRRRQGRLDEASELFELASSVALSLLGKGALALDLGDPGAAIEFAERFLEQRSPDGRADRLKAFEILVRGRIALGDTSTAREHLSELESVADYIGSAHPRALVAQLRGLLALATGEHETARRLLSDAADLYDRAGDIYLSSVSRIELAKVLRALGKHGRAEHVARRALKTCSALGAMREVERLEAFLGQSAGDPHRPNERLPAVGLTKVGAAAGLTSREAEILRLLAAGRSNQEIADALYLSVRTVERHLSNAYLKIGISGRNARAAAVAYGLTSGLA